jgi:uncharacterized protein YdeI (YjbR/CyaY-like superfamily)
MERRLAQGTAHKVPEDLRKLLLSSEDLLAVWNDLTPLARNEWICWTVSVKKEETRIKHLERLFDEIKKGKRRPCCWAGCPHR